MDPSLLNYEMVQERPHGCEICGKRFKKGNQLRQHLIIHKPPEARPYSCYICERTFNRSHHLKLHVIAHTKQSPYRCEICGRGCNQMSNLRRHLQTHEAVRSHVCPYCGKTYVDEINLTRHLTKHEANSTLYHCTLCSRSFHKPGSLEKHMQAHDVVRPFACSICNKGFIRESSLKQHLTIHSEEEPHSCDVCGRRFRRLGNFENHLITHTGYTPHICDICGKKFLQVGSYRRHQRTHDPGYVPNVRDPISRLNLVDGRDEILFLHDDSEFDDDIGSSEVSFHELQNADSMVLNSMADGETLIIQEPDGQGNLTLIGDLNNLDNDGKEYYLIEVKDLENSTEKAYL